MGTDPALVIFSALYPPHAGGVEMYTQSLARALVRSGRRTIVVTMALGADSGWSEESDIEVLRLPCRPLLGGRYPVPHRDESYRKSWSWLESQAVCGVVVNTRFYLLSCDGLRFAKNHHVVPVLIEHGSAHLTMGSPVLDAGVQQDLGVRPGPKALSCRLLCRVRESKRLAKPFRHCFVRRALQCHRCRRILPMCKQP